MLERVTKSLAAVAFASVLFPACGHAGDTGFDTEHLFGFMIGTDVGSRGEREFQSETTGRFGKNNGKYRTIGQQLELEFVPIPNFRVEVGTAFARHDINGVPGIEDRRQLAWQGLSLELRYRFMERDTAPFGLTFAAESNVSRVGAVSGARVRSYGTEFTLALDRELVPNVVAAFNLTYQPEWTRVVETGTAQYESLVGAAVGAMIRVTPGVLVGGEVRYFRHYEGVGLDEFAGQALFVGPTTYFQLSNHSRLTATWSVQAWGRPAGSNAALDLVNFERHQARLVFGVNF
ncbi:MAG: hypothetical protein HY852_06165 [Bradyrhizobium sp.]|uniref:hypothetical protein n=1 Tax=Bradyrhizobium sp. TaxID=376 RepID=UPI0025B91C1E|nr:hypothetical protein [Bradyrhizobium sp.]MBI5261388.1 hypothetical protein [Bradyrhizobium sp.]